MNFWIGLALATIFLIAAIAIFATKFLFPYHRIVALVIYAVGWVPFLYSISLKKQWILQNQGVVTSFLSAFWVHIVFGMIMLVSLYIFLVLFPVAKSPFIGLNDEEVSARLDEDQTLVLYLDQRLSSSLQSALDRRIFSVDFKNISGREKQELEDFWVSYIEVLLELDLLKERYKTFYQLNAITKKGLHQRAFINGYASFIAQHHHTFKLTQAVDDHGVRTFLNESFPSHGIESGTFDSIEDKLTDAGELLRLNTGRAYYALVNNENSSLKTLTEGYLKEIDSSLGSYAHLIAEKPLNFLEKSSFKLWFPIQKQSAIQISYIRTTSRDYHIDAKLIGGFKDRFEPGDIMLERREWHATNVGIPGFWTHSALYIGTLEMLNSYFENLPELNGKSFSELVRADYPEVYNKFQELDENGYKYEVIESKRPGVILMSLAASTNADSLAVLRVKNTDRSDRFKIVTQALSHFGKPYDFDFNFVTDNSLVCSELVFKAFQDISELNISPQEFNGRPIVSPNQFAEKFDNDLKKGRSELELALFLDGNEKTGEATEKGSEAFRETWKRPKWHIAKDFVNFE
jgi:hypothetical protein